LTKKHQFNQPSDQEESDREKYKPLPMKTMNGYRNNHTSLSNTSPLSLVLKKNESNFGINTRIENSTMRRPVSMASTTTLVINEKAKVLRDEISTLDSEIQ
jgi:hypothetical protein